MVKDNFLLVYRWQKTCMYLLKHIAKRGLKMSHISPKSWQKQNSNRLDWFFFWNSIHISIKISNKNHVFRLIFCKIASKSSYEKKVFVIIWPRRILCVLSQETLAFFSLVCLFNFFHLYVFLISFGFSNILDSSITKALIVEMRNWCRKIGTVYVITTTGRYLCWWTDRTRGYHKTSRNTYFMLLKFAVTNVLEIIWN